MSQVAETIRSQIGRRAEAMLGATYFVASDRALTFRIRGCRRGNHIRITLEPTDLYTVELLRATVRGGCQTIAAQEGVYAESLNQTISTLTGLYTSF